MDEMDEIVQEFLVESAENLDQLDQDLLALESEPDSRDKLSSAFRTIHTIKGTSGFLAFNRLEKVTHTGESLLARLRDGHQRMDSATADALLHMVDTVRDLLESIENDGAEGDVAIDVVIAEIKAQEKDGGDAEAAAGAADAATPAETATETPAPAEADTPAPAEADTPAPAEADTPVSADAETPAPAKAETPAPAVAEEKPDVTPKSAAPSAGKSKSDQSGGDNPSAHKKRSAADSSLRVDVELLDVLMRLAGELVLSRNQLMRGVEDSSDTGLSRTAQHLSVITTDIQESIMKTRMQPIEHLWAKLPRVVRDLGAQCGRQVRITMAGQETELDRALLEAIKDPLTHLVRNAVDHGIEDPEVREAAGKSREGTLSLRAYHNSGQVCIEVGDDGAGMDPAKIGDKAVEKGLRTAAEIEQMSDKDILQLVFEAGFSTAAAVTNVSGRGVGMDVVKTNLESLGGAIELESTVGQGSICRLRVPLTLAIVPALTVESAGERYAVAQASLLELVAIDPKQAASQIESMAGVPVYRLRGSLLPLISLSDIMAGRDEARTPDSDTDQVIVVLQAANQRFGLLVDRVLNTEEIVVKPLSPRLKNIGVYSGATILGDGTVALILDVQNLARRALRGETQERAGITRDDNADSSSADVERLLIAGMGDGSRAAIPMSMVTRLETIAANTVETVGTREVVQYRGNIIPLIRLDRYLGVYSEKQPAELPVAVYTQAGRSVAIVMDEIIDIVEHASQDRSAVDDRGFSGSAVVRDQIVGVLDVEQVIAAADPEFFSAIHADPQMSTAAAGGAGHAGFLPAARTSDDDMTVAHELVGADG